MSNRIKVGGMSYPTNHDGTNKAKEYYSTSNKPMEVLGNKIPPKPQVDMMNKLKNLERNFHIRNMINKKNNIV